MSYKFCLTYEFLMLVSIAVNTKIVLGHSAQAVASSCVLSDDTKLARNQTLRHQFLISTSSEVAR